MNIMKRVESLEVRLDNLQKAFEQAMRNQVPITERVDTTSHKVDALDEKVESAVVALMPAWSANGYSYYIGERVTHEGKYYRCIQSHTSQSDWTPDRAVSLWVEISDPSDEWPEWRQPTGAHDAYARGDKVSHNGKHWISDLDANVWEPGVDGWSEA